MDSGYLDPRSVARLGEVAARVDLALAGLSDNRMTGSSSGTCSTQTARCRALGPSLPAPRPAQIESAAARPGTSWQLAPDLLLCRSCTSTSPTTTRVLDADGRPRRWG